MTLEQIIRAARGQYGLPYDEREDPRFTTAAMIAMFNELHVSVAEQALCYRQQQLYTVPAADRGVSSVTLNENIFLVVPGAVRFLNGSTWIPLEYIDEQRLREGADGLDSESPGTPDRYYLRSGASATDRLIMDIYPGVSSSATNALRVDAYIYPDEALTPDYQPPLPAALHHYLVTMLVQRICEFDLSFGRADAPILLWRERAREAAQKIVDHHERLRNPMPREVRVMNGAAWI